MTVQFHKKAGKAEIYVDIGNKQRAPFRIQNKLVFPDETEFDFIHDGEQFLAKSMRILTVGDYMSSPAGSMGPNEIGTKPEIYHFAGTDEEPFLVRMEDDIKAEFDKGEDEFYDALVPEHIKTLSELYGVPWKRQGDIFGVAIPINEGNLVRAYTKSMWAKNGYSILETRHQARSHADRIEINGLGDFQAVKGKITAPDHKPQKWKGWHVVGQTRYLHNPKQAD